MPRLIAVLIALAAGLVVSGFAVGVVLPQLPAAARTQPLVWTAAAVLIACCVAVALFVTRPRRS